MSLVERALKKLQQSPPTADAPVRDSHTAVPMGVALPSGRPAHTPPASSVVAPVRVVRVDREALRAARLLPPVQMERRLASQYQHIKRSLIAAALGSSGEPPLENGRVIMVASALPGEGKTFTSINLALSMARERDMQVILVNADVAKPHLDALLGVENEPGLLDLLSDDQLHPDSVLLKTDVPRLRILPAGTHVDTATELLASARMDYLMQQLVQQPANTIVILDSPPLLLSTESQAIVPAAGQVVLVVRSSITPRSAVQAAIEAASNAKHISLILNQSSELLPDSYYGYGNYGSYGDSQSGASATRPVEPVTERNSP